MYDKHPKGVAPFSRDEVKVGDRIAFFYLENENTKWEKPHYLRCRKVHDIDKDSRSVLTRPILSLEAQEIIRESRYVIDKRPRRKRLLFPL